MHIHGATAGEVLDHSLHEVTKTSVAERFVIENHQQRGNQIAHALHVTDIQMLPNISANMDLHCGVKFKCLELKLLEFQNRNPNLNYSKCVCNNITYVQITFRNLSKFLLAKYQ